MTGDASAEYGWTQLNDDSADRELRRELGEGHVLFGVAVRGIRRCGDDVLFELTQPAQITAFENPKYAEVHLTWCADGPDRPPWPETNFYSSMPEWILKLQSQNQAEDVTAVGKREKKHYVGMTLVGWALLFILIALLAVATQL